MSISDWSSDVCSFDLSRDVGRAEADEFLVGVNPLPLLRRERLGERNGLDETDDRQQECRDRKLLPQPGVEQRHREWRQALRNVADGREAKTLEIEQNEHEGSGGHGGDENCHGEEIGRTRREYSIATGRVEG